MHRQQRIQIKYMTFVLSECALLFIYLFTFISLIFTCLPLNPTQRWRLAGLRRLLGAPSNMCKNVNNLCKYTYLHISKNIYIQVYVYVWLCNKVLWYIETLSDRYAGRFWSMLLCLCICLCVLWSEIELKFRRIAYVCVHSAYLEQRGNLFSIHERIYCIHLGVYTCFGMRTSIRGFVYIQLYLYIYTLVKVKFKGHLQKIFVIYWNVHVLEFKSCAFCL